MQTITTSGERRLKIGLTLGVIAIDALWILSTDTRFDLPSLASVLPALILMVAIAWFYTSLRPVPRLASMAEETVFLIAFSGAASILSSLAISTNLPLLDEHFVQVDKLLGFDWHAYGAFFVERPWLRQITAVVYMATLPMIALTVVGMCLTGRGGRASELVVAVMLSALGAIFLSAVLPTAGGSGHYQPSVDFYGGTPVLVSPTYMQSFFDLRSGAETLLSLSDPKGLISFPSYHVALSVLIVLAFRGTGWLFWPVLLINLAVIATTPFDGGHHLADGLGGAILAFATFAVTVFIRRNLAERPESAVHSPLPDRGPSTIPAE